MIEETVSELRLRKGKSGEMVFPIGNEIPELKDGLSHSELFSMCGRLVGQYSNCFSSARLISASNT